MALLNGTYTFSSILLFPITDQQLPAYVSMQRVEAYLAEEEVPDWACSLKITKSQASAMPHDRIGFENATFTWHNVAEDIHEIGGSAQFKLENLDINFPLGQLTLVAGRTGSGKTALLNALLGGGSPVRISGFPTNPRSQNFTVSLVKSTSIRPTTVLRTALRILG